MTSRGGIAVLLAGCLAAPCLMVLGSGVAIPMLVACIFVVGMSQGFLDANLMPSVCTVSEVRHRATGYGLMNFVGTTSGGIMTFVGGRLKDANVPFTVTFQYAAGFILVAGLLLFAVKPSSKTMRSEYSISARNISYCRPKRHIGL